MDALVKNAADEKQVKEAKSREHVGRKLELSDLQKVLQTAEGRRVIWRLISHCQVFGSIYHGSSLIHYNSGKQDVGHFLLAEVDEADQNALFKMMQESKKGI